MKDIPNYEGFYFATLDGKIFSHEKILQFGVNKRLRLSKEKKQCNHAEGYLSVVLSKNRVNKTYLVHRLIALTFLPNPENKKMVNHKYGNKKNNCIENLEWCTRNENELHAKKNGLKPKGQKNGAAKITDIQAQYIRDNYKKRKNAGELATKFKVTTHQIRRIAINQSRIIVFSEQQ